MLLSILVVSRNPSLINRMLSSLNEAIGLDKSSIEILCSWNGSKEDESKIRNKSRYQFNIITRDLYHFASNMNTLANKAKGSTLLLINDDVFLDKNSLNYGITFLKTEESVGIVGGKLRYKNNLLQHAGLVFNQENYPYHNLEKVIFSDHYLVNNVNRIVPAITGALILIKKDIFQKIQFNESYKRCGEDIELCLDIREKLNLKVWICSNFSGIHSSSTTRKKTKQYGNDASDISKMCERRRAFLLNTNKEQLLDELNALRVEVEGLKYVYNKRKIIKRIIKKLLNK